ncbi:MAG: hypothetical protein KKB70_00885, partial [Proteobacteria bacterium]|nr:hypothetical protein [Pseudomonadota bacterium]MBU1611825.1 hypothetical protein [Pseudomonadota bacterium]
VGVSQPCTREESVAPGGGEVVSRPAPGVVEVAVMPVLREPDPMDLLHPATREYRVALRRRSVRKGKARWRVARAWLLERIDRLLAAGWTRLELFAAGTTAYPYGWGLAWWGFMTDPTKELELTSEGWVQIRIQTSRGEVLQCARPMIPMVWPRPNTPRHEQEETQ